MKFTYLAAAAIAAVSIADGAHALEFDQNVTNSVIFGSGNQNGGFTTDRANGIEIGLRGKLRFDANNQPQPIYNSNGDGSYDFDAGAPSPGYGFAPNNPQTAKWNVDWSINSSFEDGQTSLAEYVYLFEIDGDPTGGVDFATVFDPLGIGLRDHSFGNNLTADNAGVETDDQSTYDLLRNSSNLVQNSFNYLFLAQGLSQLSNFDPNATGTYTVRLSALDAPGGNLLAQSSIDIQVNAVPLPAAAPLYLLALAGSGFLLRRRRKAA